MGYKRFLTEVERQEILTLRTAGASILSISKHLCRGKMIISRFLKDPEKYLNETLNSSIIKANSYTKLNNSGDQEHGESVPASSTTTTPIKKASKLNSTPQTVQNDVATTKSSKKKKVPKMIKKDYSNAKAKKPSEKELKKFNRVMIEHRAVIKFLIKKGIGPRFVYEDLKKVYENSAPDLPSTLYWAKQYQQGRQTIINESMRKNSPLSKKKLVNNNSKAKLKKTTNNNNKDDNKKSSGPAAKKITKPDIKLFKFKFKPLKRLSE